jgi:hypothetical protein
MIKKLLALVVCLAIVAAVAPSYVGAASPSGGVDAFEGPYWWGFYVYLSDASCDTIAAILGASGGSATVAAGVTAVFGVLPAAAAAGIVAGLCWIGESGINYYNRNDTGIKMRINWCIGVTGIWPQEVDPGVCGLIGNAASGYPLPYSTVTVEETGQMFETNGYGYYEIALPPGKYTLTARHDTFSPLTRYNVEVVEGEYTTVNFLLRQESPGPILMAPLGVLAGTP